MQKKRKKNPHDSHSKSLSKAISWRILATFTTMVVSYFVIHQLKAAISIGSIEIVAKIFLYYFHERFWVFSSKFNNIHE